MNSLINDMDNLELENKKNEEDEINIFYSINSYYTPEHIFDDGETLNQTIEDFEKVVETFSRVGATISLLGENETNNGIIIGNKFIQLKTIDNYIYERLYKAHNNQYPIFYERCDNDMDSYDNTIVTFTYKILVQFKCLICCEFIGNTNNQIYLLEKFRDRGWLDHDDVLCEKCG